LRKGKEEKKSTGEGGSRPTLRVSSLTIDHNAGVVLCDAFGTVNGIGSRAIVNQSGFSIVWAATQWFYQTFSLHCSFDQSGTAEKKIQVVAMIF
jgi:hypothetical protein